MAGTELFMDIGLNSYIADCFRGVVVIMFASHAKGSRFETGWKHISFP